MDPTIWIALGLKVIQAIATAWGADTTQIDWDDLKMLTIEEKEAAKAKLREEFEKHVDGIEL